MRTLIESLRRLYKLGKVAKERLDAMEMTGSISAEEKAYIVGNNAEEAKDAGNY